MTRTPEGGVRPGTARSLRVAAGPADADADAIAPVRGGSRRSARAGLLAASAAAAASTALVIAAAGRGGAAAGAWPVAAFAAALACVWSAGAVHGRRAILHGFLLGLILFAAGDGRTRGIGEAVLLGAQAWNLAALAGAGRARRAPR